MIRWAVLLALTLGGALASAQSLRIRSTAPKVDAGDDSAWSGMLRYSVLTDLNESESPRGYTQSIRAGVNYKINEHLSLAGDASVRYETFNGQIDKDREESYAEVLNVSSGLELDYEHAFMDTHSYTLFLHGEPLYDEPSRLEGYKGIVGGGASVSFGFFHKRWSMDHVLDVSELMNTYRYAEDTSYNPDIFYTYKLVNSIRLFENLRLAYAFGVKVTRYLDGFYGYSYDNTVSLSTGWKHWGFALAYENGGFTDNGDVSLWYIDEYRRLVMGMINYSF